MKSLYAKLNVIRFCRNDSQLAAAAENRGKEPNSELSVSATDNEMNRGTENTGYILLDTSNGMDGLIRQAKSRLCGT